MELKTFPLSSQVTARVKFGCGEAVLASLNESLESAARGNGLTCVAFTTVVPTMLNAFSIMTLGWLYDKMARKLTDWGTVSPSQSHC